MMKTLAIVTFAFVSVLLVSIITPGLALTQDNQPRTYYESLNLETPEDTVDTFVKAFQREDFLTVYLVLSLNAQYCWEYATIIANDTSGLFNPAYGFEQIMENLPTLWDREHNDTFGLFDTLMFDAAQHDGLLIDLRGEVRIIGSQSSQTSDEEPAVDVHATVEGIDGEVVFRTVQSASERWRVLQVIVPGGDEELLPWSAPVPDAPICHGLISPDTEGG